MILNMHKCSFYPWLLILTHKYMKFFLKLMRFHDLNISNLNTVRSQIRIKNRKIYWIKKSLSNLSRKFVNKTIFKFRIFVLFVLINIGQQAQLEAPRLEIQVEVDRQFSQNPRQSRVWLINNKKFKKAGGHRTQITGGQHRT